METRGGPWRWRCERRVAGSAACPPVTRGFSTPGCKLQYPQVISAGVSMNLRRGTGELDIPIRGFRAIPFRTRNRSVRVRLSRMRCPAPTRGVQPPRAGPSSRRDAGGGGTATWPHSRCKAASYGGRGSSCRALPLRCSPREPLFAALSSARTYAAFQWYRWEAVLLQDQCRSSSKD